MFVKKPGMQKIYPALILFIFISLHVKSQRPASPRIGRVYGKVIDAKTRQPVEFATVTLLALNKDSAISGALVAGNGDFNLERLPFGRFRLRVSFIGYQAKEQAVTIGPAAIEQDLGNIAIQVDEKVLNEVVIEGEKKAVVMAIDRRVYNVEKDLSAKGGTGIDAIRNIPGLTVDADGSVALRNSSPTIFVDGRPTTLTLEQIPADEIDRIEVITNPSARFDASTTGGILNIVMKKNTKPGYNGMITAGVGYPERYNLMGNLNIKEKRGNLGISYNLNRAVNSTRGYTNRTSFFNSLETGRYNQDNISDDSRLFQNGRVSYDYAFTNRTMGTITGGFMSGGFNTEDSQKFTQLDGSGNVQGSGTRITDQEAGWKNYNAQLQFRHTYPRRGKEWTSDLTYNRGERRNISDFVTSNFDASGNLAPEGIQLQRNDGSGNSSNITFQFDFVNPVTDTVKWEFGVRSNYRIDNSTLDVAMRNNLTGEYVSDTSLSNNYRINDLVNAAYVTYSNMFAGIGYQAGLRFEQTRFDGEILNKDQRFEYYYPDGTKNLGKAFFPSLYFTKRVGEKHEVQLNFSRKIRRPGWMEVMPFIMFADKLNYRMGNPNLAPEFMNTVEFNYNRIFPKGNFFTAVYVKQTEAAITSYSYTLPDDSSVLVTTFINGNNNYNYGWENNFRWTFFNRKLDFSFNLNGFYSVIDATVGTTTLTNKGFMFNTKAMANYKLPKQFVFQVNGSYESPRVVPQGTTLPVYSMDVSLGKEISKTLSMNLSLNDVFNSRRFGNTFQSATFEQETSRRRDTRFVRLNLTWRFGETDASLFRRKARRPDSGGGMDMEY